MANLGNEENLAGSNRRGDFLIRSPYGVALAFTLLAVLALPFDAPLARTFIEGDLPGDLVRIVYLSEIFAHGGGVILLLLTAFVLDVANRRRLVRVGMSALCGGALANSVKMLVARTRPDDFNLNSNILASFEGWLPFLGLPSAEEWDHSLQGFPSAHAATAVGFALGLAMVYPQGRRLFLAFAALASFQRMVSGSHFLSDVLVGAALGIVGAAILRRGAFLGKYFDAWENKTSTPTTLPVHVPGQYGGSQPAVSTLLSQNK